jgi:dihydrofolate reductase
VAAEEESLRQLIAAEYLSLDGRMEDPGPTGDFEHRGWTMPYWNDELATFQSDLLFASDALLLGRVTYEEFAAAWPSRSGDPFTDRMNSLPKFVASRTSHEPLAWNATLLKGDVAEEVRKLRQQVGKSILIYGSSELVNTLMQHRLIDVYRVMLYPLTLGTGRRSFRDGGDKIMLTLTSAKTTSTGVAVLTYQPADQQHLHDGLHA